MTLKWKIKIRSWCQSRMLSRALKAYDRTIEETQLHSKACREKMLFLTLFRRQTSIISIKQLQIQLLLCRIISNLFRKGKWKLKAETGHISSKWQFNSNRRISDSLQGMLSPTKSTIQMIDLPNEATLKTNWSMRRCAMIFKAIKTAPAKDKTVLTIIKNHSKVWWWTQP